MLVGRGSRGCSDESFEEAESDIRRRDFPEFIKYKLGATVDDLAEQYPGINSESGVRKLLNPNPLGAWSVYE